MGFTKDQLLFFKLAQLADEAGEQKLARASVCGPNAFYASDGERTVFFKCLKDGELETPDGITARRTGPNKFASVEVSPGKKAGEFIQFEANNVLSATLWGCEYKSTGVGCKFCRSKPYDGPRFTPEELAAAIASVAALLPSASLTLNSGALGDADENYNQLRSYIIAAKSAGMRSITIELVPVSSKAIQQFSADGVTSVQLNLELFDEETRMRVMPAKGLIPVEKYLDAIRQASDVLGIGKVYSTILLGIEPIQNSVEGAKRIIEAGGIPSPELFRALPGTEMAGVKLSASLDEIFAALKEIAEATYEKFGVPIKERFEGCLKCGGCSFMRDL